MMSYHADFLAARLQAEYGRADYAPLIIFPAAAAAAAAAMMLPDFDAADDITPLMPPL